LNPYAAGGGGSAQFPGGSLDEEAVINVPLGRFAEPGEWRIAVGQTTDKAGNFARSPDNIDFGFDLTFNVNNPNVSDYTRPRIDSVDVLNSPVVISSQDGGKIQVSIQATDDYSGLDYAEVTASPAADSGPSVVAKGYFSGSGTTQSVTVAVPLG